jgi:hypothetical protein
LAAAWLLLLLLLLLVVVVVVALFKALSLRVTVREPLGLLTD